MASKSSTYDVFVSHDIRDSAHAAQVVDVLRSHGLNVFADAQDIAAGDKIEERIWSAMAESHALVLILSTEGPSSWMAFELGAARAWNKPIYAVATDATAVQAPGELRSQKVYPISRCDEIARAIKASQEPLSDDDQKRLATLYQQFGVPVDQFTRRPQQLAKLVETFNRAVGNQWSGEQVMSMLLRLRKKRRLPPLKRRGRLVT